jgi:hypothetical protein
MVNVTQRIAAVTQPRGGYIPAKTMDVRQLSRDASAPLLLADENIHPSIIGSAVDYLTRWALDHRNHPEAEVARWKFDVPAAGAGRLDKALGTNHVARVEELLQIIDRSRVHNPDEPTPPSNAAIAAAIELASYDVAFRAGVHIYNPETNTTPDHLTTEHISIMVRRALAFFSEYGPIAVDGFITLGGHGAYIDGGDGDFVTRDTLWDFKVSVRQPSKDDTLQLLIYWLMARRGDWAWRALWNSPNRYPEAEWSEMFDLDDYLRDNQSWPDDLRGPVPTHIGIYNPRLDLVHRLAIASISAEIIAEVERDVIGYDVT